MAEKETFCGSAETGGEKAAKLVGQLTHTRSCPALTPLSDDDCTCGLEWRIRLRTEQEMHAAWRKRAEECELRELAIPESREPEKLNNAPELNMTRADDGRPQFLWFGGKYYTIEHPECMDALLKAIREFPTVSPTPTEHGAESVQSGKQNTADKSELLPTQLPPDK